MTIPEPIRLTRKDFVSDQTVRWCPGCGDYAILAQIQKAMPELGIPKEKIVFISGIGCSSRFPYYMDTYGVHSIHGRAPTLATGLKLANPDLSVWVITGDGDGLSIGGNHLIHACRRNVDLNIVLFNNRIYGLTKGQYSPTSPQGIRTKSSPMGSLEQPLNPISVALASEATFIARTVDVMQKHMGNAFLDAAAHKGISFVEVLQNCIIFNNNSWEANSNRQVRDDNNLYLEAGAPMVFGKQNDKGVIMGRSGFEAVDLGDEYGLEDLVVHDPTSISQAWMLSRLTYPLPIGIIFNIDRRTYGEAMWAQVDEAKAQKGVGDLRALYHAADTWTVTESRNGQRIESDITDDLPINIDEAYINEVMKKPAPAANLIEKMSAMTVKDLGLRAPITVARSARLDNALSVMREHNVNSLLVTFASSGHLAGIITEADIVNRVAGQVEDMHTAVVEDYMTRFPTTLGAGASLVEALYLMSTQGFRHIPIVEAHQLPVGIISIQDVVSFLAREM